MRAFARTAEVATQGSNWEIADRDTNGAAVGAADIGASFTRPSGW